MSLYHYTCDHAHDRIGESGYLLPVIALITKTDRIRMMRDSVLRLTTQVVWLTTMDKPGRMALGLTNAALCCDRTAHRYRVTDEKAVIRPWSDVRLDWPTSAVNELESLPGCKPAAWWLARGPVAVEYAPLAKRAPRVRVS